MLHKSFLWMTLLALGMIAHSANAAKAAARGGGTA